MSRFTHLHLHTQYSVLDGANEIGALIARVKELGMEAVAITDHGNMYGVKEFHKTAKANGIKPILGCEAYVARRGLALKETKEDRSGEHIILLAKNEEGYKNLLKLVSISHVDGFYYKPRIDKELLFKHNKGIIVSTACLGGTVPQAILKGDNKKAEQIAQEYKEVFGDDYYLELQIHKTDKPDIDTYERQKEVNKVILEIAKKLDIKVVATNDVHFLRKEDADAHDLLIRLNTKKTISQKMQMYYTGEEYLKSPEEMTELFADVPEAIENTQEITDKIEFFELDKKPIMPKFELPEGFDNEADYLRHIVYEGAKECWDEITPEIEERLNFELDTIIGMGFPGYFLIVWDFLKAAREMGVWVGPGRGSAAGSAVAYTLKIIMVDPIKYDLLFERFLNPDRISMPDIDIDFDDDGREKILKWVVEKYGKKRVANIITYGTMASKSSIRDVARVMEFPLYDADKLAKLVPDKVKNLKQAYEEVEELKTAYEGSGKESEILKYAELLEGSVRQTGVHACGIIISRDDLVEHIPVSTSKESDLLVTQYEGKHVENVGLLKMDFLGLRTLAIMKDAVANIKKSRGIDINVEELPLDDKKVFELFSRGETTALFQFESDNMKKYLRMLKPTHFEDLVAMNALYRPGPMQYIDSFIRRKHGKEEIIYDHPDMAEILEDTYGITVYQEQVMRLSRKMAGFTRGQADSLRKAMGKKIIKMMEELKPKFFDGCKKNGYEEKLISTVWNNWEEFAKYAFNRSHSLCYAYLAYQTGYLKAHYPPEFMAAALTRNISDITKVQVLMEETKRMGIEVHAPDVNSGYHDFQVEEKGIINFGLGAIKGVGKGAVEAIVEERENNGKFKDFYNFVERVNLNAVNKRTIEALVLAGAFDKVSSDIHRSEYFYQPNENSPTFIEETIKYGNRFQGDGVTAQQSIFGAMDDIEIVKPKVPHCQPWSLLERLNREKEVIGIYLSEHPLDKYKFEIEHTCTPLSELESNLDKLKGKEVKTAGIITKVRESTTKNGNLFGSFEYEDFSGKFKVTLFGKDYLNLKQYIVKDLQVYIKGKVANRFGKPDAELEYKVGSIEMLSEVKDKLFKAITIRMPIEKITENFVGEFTEVINQNQGNVSLFLLIYDLAEKIKVPMNSRSKKVNINKNLIDYLSEKTFLDYRIS